MKRRGGVAVAGLVSFLGQLTSSVLKEETLVINTFVTGGHAADIAIDSTSV